MHIVSVGGQTSETAWIKEHTAMLRVFLEDLVSDFATL